MSGREGVLGAYRVDPDELAEVVAHLARTERALIDLGADLDRRIGSLHEGWSGLAAQAHEGAHRRWLAGLDDLHQAVGGLRAVSDAAHMAYTAAARGNVDLWDELA